jgi:hypothetical protein
MLKVLKVYLNPAGRSEGSQNHTSEAGCYKQPDWSDHISPSSHPQVMRLFRHVQQLTRLEHFHLSFFLQLKFPIKAPSSRDMS